MWDVWDYDNNYLGNVLADNLGAAIRLARKCWPDKLHGDLLFDIIRRELKEDQLIKLLKDTRAN